MNQNFKCCDLNFQNFNLYATHMRLKHATEKLKCLRCGLTKNGWSDLRRHFNETHKSYQEFLNEDAMENEIISHKNPNVLVQTENPEIVESGNESSVRIDSELREVSDFETNEDLYDIYANFLMELKFDHNLTQTAVELVISGTNKFLGIVFNKIKV
jgi:hypothetical protein